MIKLKNFINNNEKLEFAHVLRGMAALIVVLFAHLGGVFFTNPNAADNLINAPYREVLYDNPFNLISFIGLNAGHLGVSLFFLISGFVIPFSLLHYSKIQFLVARFFRIWPTYFFGLMISLLALKISNNFYNITWSYSLEHIFYQMILIRDLMWMPSIDGVSWTLEIEIKFYIISSLFFFIIYRKMKIEYFLLGIILLSLLAIMMGIYFNDTNTRVYQIGILFVIYMGIGVLFNFHHRKGMSTKVLIFSILMIFVIFIIVWKNSYLEIIYITGTINYGISLIIFSIFYLYRYKINKNKVFDFLGNISYPLYVIHPLVGYTSMRIFLNYYPKKIYISIVFALILSIILAYILHITVEKRSNKFGKKLAREI